MQLLKSNGPVKFKDIRESTGLSDGYLWSHIRALESDGYMAIQKEINGRKVKTTYDITQRGTDIFRDFRATMLNLLA